jgi:hypothetical protein
LELHAEITTLVNGEQPNLRVMTLHSHGTTLLEVTVQKEKWNSTKIEVFPSFRAPMTPLMPVHSFHMSMTIAEFPAGVNRLDSIYANNDINPSITFTENGTLRFTWLGETAGNLNDVYIITLDESNNILSETLIFKQNDRDQFCNLLGQKFDIEYPAGTTVGIKLVGPTSVFYTVNAMNENGNRHFAALPYEDTVIFGIEDLSMAPDASPRSDKDFNDGRFDESN